MSPIIVLLFAAFGHIATVSAGRAFPTSSKDYVISAFTGINPKIVWDPTNFLVDLSGLYAQCSRVGERGNFEVDRTTADGASIGGLVDYGKGFASDVDSVNGYIRNILDGWKGKSMFTTQIARAETFGCSVMPGCDSKVVIACLFSPEYRGTGEPPDELEEEPVGSVALAFTREQYNAVERMTGTKWDRSSFLENLSGLETQCAMINLRSYDFPVAKQEASKRGLRLSGLFGSAPNKGDTGRAISEIISAWKRVTAEEIGCSVIPDCRVPGGSMQVVVSCIYRQ